MRLTEGLLAHLSISPTVPPGSSTFEGHARNDHQNERTGQI